ncbi:hypothetical protein GCM10027049_22330 [Mucilaginibacter puniceus]
MALSDESFREAYKPLHIPAHYDINDPEQDRVLFALAQIGIGTVNDVATEMAQLEEGVDVDSFIVLAGDVLTHLYELGLLKGSEINGEMQYNLSKITHANEGAVDPDLLAPGLD